MSDQHDGLDLYRRALLRGGIAAGGVAGLGLDDLDALGRAAAAPDDDFAFFDDFEDGDFTADPAWSVYLDEGNFSASVANRSVPGGGSKVLSLTETTGGGTSGILGWSSALGGWDGAWTLSGQFYTREVSVNVPFQAHQLLPVFDPDTGGSGLNVKLGFSDGSNNVVPFRITGSLVDSVEASHDPGWQEGQWYRYEVSHDGSGTYTGRLWEVGSGRPAEPNARSVGSAPGTDPRVAALKVNGARGAPFDMEHAFVGWRTAPRGYLGTYYNLPRSHPDMEGALDGDGVNRGLVRETLPLRLTDAGEAYYEQFDWFTDQYRSFQRRDDAIDFPSDFLPVDEGLPGDPFHFAVHWEATLVVPEDGEYTFELSSDDDSWAFVDGGLVVDNGGLHGTASTGGSVTLEAGEHSLDVFFAERHTVGSDVVFTPDPRVTVLARRADDGTGGAGLADLVDAKRNKIRRIRNIATATLSDYDTDRNPGEIDSAAERYLDDLEPRLDELSPEEADRHREVLRRLDDGERISIATLSAVNAPVGIEGHDVVEQFADAGVDAISSVVMGKLFERIARVGRGASSSATRRLIQSSTFEDFVTGLNRQADSFFFGTTFGDDVYESIYRDVARDQLAFHHLWADEDLGDGVVAVYQNAIKNLGVLPEFGEGGALEDANFFAQVEELKAGARRFIERETYETVLFRDDGIPNQLPVAFGPVSTPLPDLPDAVPVPYADEAEGAANTVLGWVEDAAEAAGQIKELPSVDIEELEDPEIDLPDEIALPEAWSIPDTVGFDRIEVDAGRALNQIDDLIPVGYSGVGAELAEEVTILLDKLEEDELDRQPAEVREELVSLFEDFYDQLVDGMEVMFTGYDVMRKIGELAELIAIGVAGVGVLVVSMLSLLSFGASLVLVPILGIYVEIIGLLNAMVAAVEGLTGYAFIATAATGHSGGLTTALNGDLDGTEVG